jgi:hypothetical protein
LAAAWAARIVVVISLVLFLLFWPILVDRHSSAPTVRLGVACSNLAARMRQQPSVTSADITQVVAHPECWSEQANTRPVAAGAPVRP